MSHHQASNRLFSFDKKTKVQAWIFLVIWPGINIFINSIALQFIGRLTDSNFFTVFSKIWGIFAVTFVGILLVEYFFRKPLRSAMGEYTWLLRPVAILILFFITEPAVKPPGGQNLPNAKLIPLVVITLEIIIYIAVMLILQQQQNYYRSQLRAREAELQALKMQSNPHFLFNTLNLIANQLSENPEKAKEVIFNLSDLLRNTVRLAKIQWITVEEELQMVELYLLLQQKRFEDRLTFDIDCATSLNHKMLPSLLLLPVVENAIKHGVAPYAEQAHIGVNIELNEGYLEIEVMDTGGLFDETKINYGEGMRILAETLRLHFSENYSMKLTSTREGASMKIRLPDIKRSSEHV